MKEHGFEVLTKTPGINKVSKMRSNTTFTTTTATTSTIGWGHRPVLGGGLRENSRSLSSPKDKKYH